jgi:tetratricopeptide (TPR) repeat protein
MPHPAFFRLRRIALPALAAAAAFAAAGTARAQQDVLVPVNSTSQAVVQPLPPEGTQELNAALKRLAIDSNDVDALLAAGNASLKLHDTGAAIGFFSRAQALGSTNGAAEAGLASADVYEKKPVEALKLFAKAQAEGASLKDHASDYGLAYDLVGDNARAQQFYRMALAQGPDDLTTRRLALSEAIGGDQAASEKTLLPLLQHRDLAAYRTRAFALAALGKTDEAVSIAEAIMPASLAGRIAPYLRYMPKLTRAQQAAAANFGHFPEAGAIGHDDPRIAEYAKAAQPVTVAARSSDTRLVPAGAPLGAAAQPAPPPAGPVITAPDANTPPAKGAARLIEANAPPPFELASLPHSNAAASLAEKQERLSAPAPNSVAAETGGELPPLARQPSEQPPPGLPPVSRSGDAQAPAPNPPPPAPPATSRTGPILAPAQPVSKPSLGAPTSAKAQQPSLEDAFAEFEKVKTPAEPPPGAVDITEIKPPRATPEPPKPVDPSRIWVQVATGKDRKALGFDWRRKTRKASAAFRGKHGYLVKWGRTNRLVTGPFDNQKQAQAFVDDVRRAGLKTFIFTSKRGERVEPLP